MTLTILVCAITYVVVGFFVGIACLKISALSNSHFYPSLYKYNANGKPRLDEDWGLYIVGGITLWPAMLPVWLVFLLRYKLSVRRAKNGKGPVLDFILRLTSLEPPR